MIHCKSLSKHYGTTRAVDDISFEVAEGEILGLLGPNGAGKTTTMRILTGFMPPTKGTATLAGHDVLEEPEQVRRAIGYMPENPPVYPDMVVASFLRFVSQIKEVPAKQINRGIEEAMEKVNITHMRRRIIGHLSRGYRQRVGLAQAIVHNPQILILDEPTLGLDPTQIIEIRELIKSLAGNHTIILSSHILHEVQAICSRVIILNQGKIVAQDTLNNLTEGQRVYLTLKGLAKEEGQIKESFAHIEEITEITPRKTTEDSDAKDDNLSLQITISSKNGKDARELSNFVCEKIYKISKEKNWTLLEMGRAKTTLEEIFLHTVSGK